METTTRRIDHATGIDALQLDAGELARADPEVPPRYAVLRAHYGGVLADQRLHLRRERDQPMRLHAEHDDIEFARAFETADHPGAHFEIAFRADHAQPALTHRFEMLAARKESHILVRARHLRADVTADGARAGDQKPHAPASAFATAPR
jgi:hypothetical protein